MEPRRRRLGGALLALLLAAVAQAAGAQETGSVQMEVTVVRASDAAGGVDARAKRLDRVLRGQVAYQSLAFVASHHRKVAVDEVWSVRLPAGGDLRVRPLDAGSRGALLSVDWTDVVQGDFRVRPGRPLIFGGPAYEGGKLVVVIDTR